MNPSRCVSVARSRPRLTSGRAVALFLSTIAISCVCAPPAAMANPPSAEVRVQNASGKAAELLDRLTLPQFAAVLKTSPAELNAQVEGLNLHVGLELGELLTNPKATVQEVLGLLAAHGVSTAPVEQLINRLLAGVTDSGEQLRLTINQVLADLRENGQIEQLAKELVLPTAAVEGAQLVPTTVEKLASTLGATSDKLVTTLLGAGATSPVAEAGSKVKETASEASSRVPFVASILPQGGGKGSTAPSALGETVTALVGAPTGKGGLTLTTINSNGSGPSASSASNATISNAFRILSISVTKAGLIRETVSLPGPGRLAIGASTRRKVAFRSKNGRRRTATRTATLASVGETLSGGVHTVTIRPRGAAARARPLAVKLATTYTPTGGSPSTIQRSVTIASAAKKRRR